MNRACEVALGVKTRRKPFIEPSYRADSCNEIHKYHSEDEQVIHNYSDVIHMYMLFRY